MAASPRNVEVYETPDGGAPFDDWFVKLKAKDKKAAERIDARIANVRRGVLGDIKSVGDGMIELRLDFGPGYRIYCIDDGANMLIFCAGRKQEQGRDMRAAKDYLEMYKGEEDE